MNSFAGMRVFVSRPRITWRRRGWHERLFSLPWRPMEPLQAEVIPAAVPADACYRAGNDLHCGEIFYEKLKAYTQPPAHRGDAAS